MSSRDRRVLSPVIAAAIITSTLVACRNSNGAAAPSCNGSVANCDRRLDQVVLPTSHNSMSSRQDHFDGPNQDRGLRAQLEYGIRGLLIDAYLGARADGVVITDVTSIDAARMARELGPRFGALAASIVRRVGTPPRSVPRRVYLCHVACEVGAVPMRQAALTIKRFLEAHPFEVLVVVIENSAEANAIQRVLTSTGLQPYQLRWTRGRRLPTLQAMIDSGKRLLVAVQRGRMGSLLANAYEDGLLQETPYSFASSEDIAATSSCDPQRGSADAPLFLVNHWLTPVDRVRTRSVNDFGPLSRRIERCATARRRQPNLIAVDFVERGGLIEVARSYQEHN